MIDFEVWHDHGVGLVQPFGALDAAAAPCLRRALSEAATLTRLPLIAIVDGATTSVDTIPTTVLLIEHARLRTLGGTLAVVGTGGPIATTLQRGGLADDIPVFDTLEEALTTLTHKAQQ